MAKTKNKLFTIALIVTLGGLLFGHNTAVVNGSLSFIVQNWAINDWTQGIISSALTLAAAFGAVFGGGISDRIGRKKMLRLISWIFLIGAVGCAAAPNVGILIASRFFLGLAVGSASAIIPLYLAEISTATHRGKMVGLNQVMIVGGQFLAFLLNAILGSAFIEYVGTWRMMMGMATIPAIIMIIGMTKVFESPKWLMKQGKIQDAVEIIKSIYSDKQEQEAEIAELQEMQQQGTEVHIKTAGKIPGWALRVLLIGCLLGVIQQFIGINAIMYYSTNILQEYGFGQKAALIFNVLNGVICVVASLIGMNIADKMGRKKLENTGLAFCALALILVGVLSNVLAGQSFAPYVILVMIFLYIFAFQGAVGPCTWILISEIFPAQYRGTFSGIAVFVLWIANFLVGLLFPVLMNIVGINALFYGFATCAVLGIVVVNTMVPETKGKTLDEIEAFFTNVNKKDQPQKNG
nr:sugar porter family MFS transporter [uncultured Bacillus sp.]